MTNSLSFLPQVNHVVYIEDGTIIEQGTYTTLNKRGKSFSSFIKSFLATKELKDESKDTVSSELDLKLMHKSFSRQHSQLSNKTHFSRQSSVQSPAIQQKPFSFSRQASCDNVENEYLKLVSVPKLIP